MLSLKEEQSATVPAKIDRFHEPLNMYEDLREQVGVWPAPYRGEKG